MATSMPKAALLALSSGGARSSVIEPASAQVPLRAVAGAIESAFLREQVRQQLLSTPKRVVPAHGEDATSDDQSPHQVEASVRSRRRTTNEKKRKSTYYARKDEMAQLHQEIAMLQEELRRSKGQAPEFEARALVSAMTTNAGLQDSVRHADLTIASAQSLMSSYGTQCRSSPIGGFIHLPQDPVARQQVLAELKESRLREALTYALTRSRFLSVTTFSKQMDAFETESGDFVTTHWEITPLEEARSVEQAYRELLYFTDTQEMSMTEKLGMLTVRESESDPVDGAQTVRMMSKHESGVESDTNLAVFSQFFESSEMLQQPHGLLVVDFIDQDELYPTHINTRIRKDVASLTLITEAPSASRGGLPVVTMVRWAFVRVNNSAHATRAALEEVAREGVGKWCDVMLKCVRERLAWHAE